LERVRKTVMISLLAGIAVVIYIVESMIPTPSPWLRYGFSHIISLFTLIFYGVGITYGIFAVRSVIGALLVGKLFSPTFIIGITGGCVAIAVMAVIVYGLRGRGMGLVGISVCGAWINSLVQVVVAFFIFIRHPEIFMILPLFLLFAVITGMVNGIAVFSLNRYGQRALGLENRFFQVEDSENAQPAG